jgi:hypothetical protein
MSSTSSVSSPKRKPETMKSNIDLLEMTRDPTDTSRQEVLLQESTPNDTCLRELHVQMGIDKHAEKLVPSRRRFRSASTGRAETPSRRHGPACRAAMRSSSVTVRRSITPNRRHDDYVSLADSVSLCRGRK